ncbi:MAG: hypothetical protein ACK4S2_01010 [Gemmobacter sp.]|uniref:hypothetical protein n=1 Tax=Gemmobacter sp. TaxID=1898957 RepID=UPI003918829E
MTYVADSVPPIPRARRPFLRMIAGLLKATANPRAASQPMLAPPSSGPAVEALVDADVARMAQFGSWSALRDDLRARAEPNRRNSA